MNDQIYTLIIPTFNRPESIERLLRYLVAQNVDFPVRVLDSSRQRVRKLNRKLIASLPLTCEYVEFPEDTHPFDKFREGIEGVKTPLCGLCADDDLPIVEGLRASFDFLEKNPDYTVAHGYYFQFALDENQMQITTITYYTPDYDMDEPLARLHALMRHYQALTYGTYRQETLLKIFNMVRPVESILARELLSSALAVVYGKIARIPVLFAGRNLGPSSSYKNWHPLEWLIGDPEGLFKEYVFYRNLILNETLASSHNGYDKVAAQAIIDLIHMQYLARHMPDESFDHIVMQSLDKIDATQIFTSHPVMMGLVNAAADYSPLPGTKTRRENTPTSVPAPINDEVQTAPEEPDICGTPDIPNRHSTPEMPEAPQKIGLRARFYRRAVGILVGLEPIAPRLVSRLRTAKRRIYAQSASENIVPQQPAVVEVEPVPIPVEPAPLQPVTFDTDTRRYVLAPDFVDPPESFDIQLDKGSTKRLIQSLDFYR